MNLDDLPEHVFVTDANGVPERFIDTRALTDAGFTLAARLGAARGDQLAISDAISEVIHEWDDAARFVFVSSLTQLSRDLVPMVAELTKAATGVDFAKHCEAMLAGEYAPSTVDGGGTR